MNCSEIDATSEYIQTFVIDNDWGFALACVGLLVPSALLLVAGEQLMRVLSSLTAGVAAAVTVFLVTETIQPTIACETRLVVAAIAGVGAAVVAICIIRTGLFILGAAGFGAVAHLVYDSLPLENVDGPFSLLGRPGYYYLVMGGMIILGAIVGVMQKREFVRISSSLLGAGGVTLVLHVAVERGGERVPPVALLLVLLVSTVGGVFVQYRRREVQRRRADGGRARGGTATGVPVGTPVAA
jgi:hypothetical protein